MGSKKKKRSRAKQGSHNGTPRSTQTDRYEKYAKYAGAVSNKSKRNYADLRLVRPDDLKEYASENARPRTGQPTGQSQKKARPTGAQNGSRQRTAAPKSARNSPSQPKQNPNRKPKRGSQTQGAQTRNVQVKSAQARNAQAQKTRSAQSTAHREQSGGGLVVSSFGTLLGSLSAGMAQRRGDKARQAQSSRQKTAEKPAKSASAGRAPRKGEYIEDEYSRALNNLDFYGDILGKHSLKYADEPRERKSSVGTPPQYAVSKKPKVQRRRIKQLLNDVQHEDNLPQKPQKSIAELAVKNRGTADKKKYAKVVKNGKAKGSVPIGAVHRKVHRRNRRQSLFIGAAAVSSAALVMLSVIFFAFFKVKKIEVAGETPYSDTRITELCEFNKGDNLMFIDTVNSEKQVLDTLPYIESCKIRRTIPNMVEVNVTCANALGVAEIGNGFWSIVSTSGKVLENVSDVAIVSASDVVTSASYEPDIHSVEELAAAKELPVLSGLEFKSGKVGEYVKGASVDSINGFDTILKQADAFGMNFTKLKYTDRGYEAEYDGRINIVLGDTTDETIIRKRIEIANYIICVTGDITEHDMGEITYLKNQTFFNPTYDISEEELAKYSNIDESSLDELAKFGKALLDGGVDAVDGEPKKPKTTEAESAPSVDNPTGDIADSLDEDPQET